MLKQTADLFTHLALPDHQTGLSPVKKKQRVSAPHKLKFTVNHPAPTISYQPALTPKVRLSLSLPEFPCTIGAIAYLEGNKEKDYDSDQFYEKILAEVKRNDKVLGSQIEELRPPVIVCSKSTFKAWKSLYSVPMHINPFRLKARNILLLDFSHPKD